MPFAITTDAATISTAEYSLPADTTVGVPTAQTDDCLLQVWIDFGAMVAGDVYEVRIYEAINGTQRVLAGFPAVLVDVQVGPYVTPALFMGEGWDVTVKRTAGADRSIGWSLRKIT